MVVAPVQRCDQRLMPWICSSPAELQEIEARSQSCHRIHDSEDSHPSGGEFYGEWNTVKLAANLGNHGSFVVTERKLSAAGTAAGTDQARVPQRRAMPPCWSQVCRCRGHFEKYRRQSPRSSRSYARNYRE